MGHGDLSSVPVNLGVVYKPCVAEDDSHPANTSNMESGSFQVTLVLDDEVHELSNVTSFMGSSIYIIDRDGSGEVLGA